MKILPVSTRINAIKKYNFNNKQIRYELNSCFSNPLSSSGSNKYNVYFGRDLVHPVKKDDFEQTLKENYYHLPEGCFPDEFQIEAGKALLEGRDVLVEAPTGTGKTAVAHYAASKNMKNGTTTFYTTPLKALSNQKLNEFRQVYGEENVGILTGDRRENANAPILIMTTEVYRNMALSNMYGEKNPLMDNLATVIFDEFHYLGDNNRGPVWEESLMFTPENVQTLELSATIGNPDDLKNWIANLKNENVSLISIPSSSRHVPLKYGQIKTASYKQEEKRVKKSIEQGYSPELSTLIQSKPALSDFRYAVEKLEQKEQLPAIFFVFSKNFSRDLLDYFGEEGKDLTTEQEKEEINKIVTQYQNKKYIGSDLNIDALEKGYAIHNAGIIPGQKELIEELFQKKLIKAVIATETLAAGINMPAKTVVISSPYKPDDSADNETGHRLLTSNEFKQMSGRAGRRGIDTVGYVYTMPAGELAEQEFLCMEALDCNPITSKYNPGYDYLSGYYEHYNDDTELSGIFEKSFYAYSNDNNEKKEKVLELKDLSSKKTKVLLDRKFLKVDEDGKIHPTLMSKMASKIHGYDVLTLTETIADGNTFSQMSPEVLSMTAGAMANPAEYRDTEINPETDILPIFEDAAQRVDMLQKRLMSSVSSLLKKTGKNFEDFTNYDDMLLYAKSIQKPEKSVDELYEELRTQEKRKSKVDSIINNNVNYTLEELVKAMKKGDVIPSKELQYYSDELNNYKKRIKKSSISGYIEAIETAIKAQEEPQKGKKARTHSEKVKNNLIKELEEAKMMEYLDEHLVDVISSNFQFLKNNPPKQVILDYKKAEELYSKAFSKERLINEIKALAALEDNSEEENVRTVDIKENYKKTYECFNNLKNKSFEIYSNEMKNNIPLTHDKCGKTSAQILYTWAYLNKINPNDTMANWEQLLGVIPHENADEGTIYRTILQTADLLSQIGEMAEIGINESENEEEIDYYSELKDTAAKSRNLILKEPVEV